MGPRSQTEVTPGNVLISGCHSVLQNQSMFNFWDIRTGDNFIELEGKHYGWDSATVQVAEYRPGLRPAPAYPSGRRDLPCCWRARSHSRSAMRCWT